MGNTTGERPTALIATPLFRPVHAGVARRWDTAEVR